MFEHLLLITVLLLTAYSVHSQSTIILKPGPGPGKDATVCNSPTWNTGDPPNTQNYGGWKYLRNESWTANSNGSPEHDWRSLILFEALDTMGSLDILSATLKLYAVPDFPHSNGGQYGDNQTEVFRITEPWEELEVTWLTQPAYDPDNSITIPTNNNYDSILVDVTDWAMDMAADPASNLGFILIPSNDSPYRSMDFASSDHEDETRWPELVIEYGPVPPPEPADTCVFEFPNVFTPDGNGVNDIFGVVSNCTTGFSVNILIYDRWGNKVFSSSGAPTGWDGKIRGKSANSGVYIFKASIEYGEDRYIFVGNLTLLR